MCNFICSSLCNTCTLEDTPFVQTIIPHASLSRTINRALDHHFEQLVRIHGCYVVLFIKCPIDGNLCYFQFFAIIISKWNAFVYVSLHLCV